ncbi:MAG: hypothetical protein HY592_04240 [Candidatus Omnitrophica bacterium]|nr:hypothetical protein [Candidatus Omnitrophota bacterium]
MKLFEKLTGFFFERSLDIAKIEAAAAYIRGVKWVRDNCVAVCVIFVCLVTISIALVLVPLGLILSLPIEPVSKGALIALFGIVCVLVPVAVLSRFLSEKKWLELSRVHELLKKVVDK